MKKAIAFIVVALLVGAISAQAGTVVLGFEGLGNNEPVLNYYNGGFGGNGTGPAPNYGITFGPDALAIIANSAGGTGNVSGAPTMPTTLYFLTGPGDVMNVPAGFTTGFSFFYSAIAFPGSVSVYDGLDGTGNLLASLNLPLTPSGGAPGCTPAGPYCPWEPIGVSFNGTAQSVVFSGSANYITFDNITLGSQNPIGAPEPASLGLLAAGLAGLASFLRRR